MATAGSSILDVQSLAAEFANNFLNTINATVAETVGVDVMWFRATPDKRSEDVIFQDYTLYGVEDCPLEFKAVYSDNGYDDAAITYNIMGLEYSVPLTLEIAVNTWYEVTGYDGTLPQRGDIVFIPLSRKLLEVVSMTPIKKIAAQVTGYKVNLSIYKPTRSRIVGENLKESIENSTVNLKSRFGEEIDETLANIVDDDQLSIFSTTEVDREKKNAISKKDDSIYTGVNNIIEKNILIDGHTVSRSYYDLEIGKNYVVKYTHSDHISEDSTRCYSAWVKLKDSDIVTTKNIQSMTLDGNALTVNTTKKMKLNDEVIISRGSIAITGIVTSLQPYIITLNKSMLGKINETSEKWYTLPGFTIEKTVTTELLSSEGASPLKLKIKSAKVLSISLGDTEETVRFPKDLKYDTWYGVIVNMGKKLSVDIYTENEQLESIIAMSGIKLKNWSERDIENYKIGISTGYLTNIRLYDVENTELDKQIMDLVTYSIPNNKHAIINDSTDIYLDKKYIGLKG